MIDPQKYGDTINRRREAWERKFAKRLREYFRLERAAVLEALKADVDYAIAINGVSKKLEDIYLYYYVKVYRDFASSTYKTNMDARTFAEILVAYDDAVKPFIDRIGEKIVAINAVTMGRIQKAIEKGRANRGTIADVQNAILDEVNAEFKSMSASRALTIARTEVGSLSSFGQLESFRQSGFKKKQWNSINSPITRDSHAALDGETVEINSKFSNGLMQPLDPNGEAAEIINCRCSLIPIVE